MQKLKIHKNISINKQLWHITQKTTLQIYAKATQSHYVRRPKQRPRTAGAKSYFPNPYLKNYIDLGINKFVDAEWSGLHFIVILA